MNEDEKKEAEE